MATENFFIKAEDGWIKVAGACDFVRITPVPQSGGFSLFHSGSAPPVNSTQASGTITLSSTGPTNTQTVTVNGLVYTFKTSPSGPRDVQIGVDNPTTASSLASVITSQDTVHVAAVAVGSVVTVNAVEPGTAGNSITLAQSASNVAVSGATLSGAVDLAVGVVVNCKFVCNVPFAGNLYARVDSTLPDRPLRLDVFSIPSA